MTPKEKAKELVEQMVDKLFDLRDGYNPDEVYNSAKQCALITVDAIIFELMIRGFSTKYFEGIKEEINKL